VAEKESEGGGGGENAIGRRSSVLAVLGLL
jgi:hypothetical protein